MGITRFIENHFVEIHKDDKKISGRSHCQNYLWPFLPMVPITPRPVGRPWRCQGMDNRPVGSLEVLGD
jgi:hypothetical protein